jgi:hypothetical protein
MSEEAASLVEDLLLFIDGDDEGEQHGHTSGGISDRRLVKAVQMLKLVASTRSSTSAVGQGGGGGECDAVYVSKSDCWLLQHVFWSGRGGEQEEEALRHWLACRICTAVDAAPTVGVESVSAGSGGSNDNMPTLAALDALEQQLEDLFGRTWVALVEIESQQAEHRRMASGQSNAVDDGSMGASVGSGSVGMGSVGMGSAGMGDSSIEGSIGSSVRISDGGGDGSVQDRVDDMAWTAGWDVMGARGPLDLNHHLSHLEPAKGQEQGLGQEQEQKQGKGGVTVEVAEETEGGSTESHAAELTPAELTFLRSCEEDKETREGLLRRVMLWQKQEAINTKSGNSGPIGDAQLGYVDESEDEVNTARAVADEVWAKRQKRIYKPEKTEAEQWHADQQRWQQKEWERAGMEAAMAALAATDLASGDAAGDGGADDGEVATYAQTVEVAERAAHGAAREAAKNAAVVSAAKATDGSQQGFQHGNSSDKWRTPANLSKMRMHAAFAAHAAIEAKTELLQQRYRRSKGRQEEQHGDSATESPSALGARLELELYDGLYREVQELEQALESHHRRLRDTYHSDLHAVQSHPWFTPEEVAYIEQLAAPTFAAHWAAGGRLAKDVLTLRAALEYGQTGLDEDGSRAAGRLQLRSLCACLPKIALDRLEALVGAGGGSGSTTEEKLQALHVMAGLGLLRRRGVDTVVAGNTPNEPVWKKHTQVQTEPTWGAWSC